MRSSLLAAPLGLVTLRSLWKPRRDSYANARLYEDNRIGMPEAASTHRQRCIELMTKEILLAQSSDWPFLMKNEPSREYAERRTREHLERFDVALMKGSAWPANGRFGTVHRSPDVPGAPRLVFTVDTLRVPGR
jgi:hypothetical protein